MQQSAIALNPSINLWRAWMGFNLTHSLGAVMFGGAFRSLHGDGRRTFVIVAAIAAGVLGLWWGGLAIGTSGAEEGSVLRVYIPASFVMGLLVWRKAMLNSRGVAHVLKATAVTYVLFYATFGLGFAWVWGYFGF